MSLTPLYNEPSNKVSEVLPRLVSRVTDNMVTLPDLIAVSMSMVLVMVIYRTPPEKFLKLSVNSLWKMTKGAMIVSCQFIPLLVSFNWLMENNSSMIIPSFPDVVNSMIAIPANLLNIDLEDITLKDIQTITAAASFVAASTMIPPSLVRSTYSYVGSSIVKTIYNLAVRYSVPFLFTLMTSLTGFDFLFKIAPTILNFYDLIFTSQFYPFNVIPFFLLPIAVQWIKDFYFPENKNDESSG